MSSAESSFSPGDFPPFIEPGGTDGHVMVRDLSEYAAFISGCLLEHLDALGMLPNTYNFHSTGSLRVAVAPVPVSAGCATRSPGWRIVLNHLNTDYSSGITYEQIGSADHIIYPDQRRLADRNGTISSPIEEPTRPRANIPPIIETDGSGFYYLYSHGDYRAPSTAALPLLRRPRVRRLREYNRMVTGLVSVLGRLGTTTRKEAAPIPELPYYGE